MGKVINLFTGKPLEVQQNKDKNDEATSEHGTFVGAIPDDMAQEVARHQANVEALGARIDELMGEYLFMLDQHNDNIDIVLTMLKVKHYDPENQVVMVSEEGKVWLVDREELE